ncbi:hypothetical protein NXS08_02525 [Gleimia sp. 6138-11-ORH1]|uniref:hypothetical protein n=1 Tax=Gleimia sp. 6138-11-ORH1 TaxID=2973937 RepID=UPI0021685A26|nr:hypothetical protein [Gleimia sp. 6138-11-ORH1]MCS4484366.1 hypothetical protein [Gleimia sp. 6138-11-ORH1]
MNQIQGLTDLLWSANYLGSLTQLVISLSAIGLSVALGSPLVNFILKQAAVEPVWETNYSGTQKATLLNGEKPAREILRGGLWIGRLERFAVTLIILTGTPVMLSAVIAVKGLGRYPELKAHPHSAEKFIIGTAVSIIWAALCGIAGNQLLQML